MKSDYIIYYVVSCKYW